MDPLTIAILAGTQFAQGAIGGIGKYQQAKGMMSPEEQKRLDELQRRQELGTLGYTDTEIDTLTAQYRDPQMAIAKAQSDDLKATMAAQEMGAADTFRMAMIQEEQQRQQNADIARTINEMNLVEQRRQEEQLYALANKEHAMEQAKKGAIIEAVTGGLVGAGTGYTEYAMFNEEMANSNAQFDQQMKMLEKQAELNRSVNPYLTGAGFGGVK